MIIKRFADVINVFDIASGMRKDKKFEKYYEGKISFEDLQYEDLVIEDYPDASLYVVWSRRGPGKTYGF